MPGSRCESIPMADRPYRVRGSLDHRLLVWGTEYHDMEVELFDNEELRRRAVVAWARRVAAAEAVLSEHVLFDPSAWGDVFDEGFPQEEVALRSEAGRGTAIVIQFGRRLPLSAVDQLARAASAMVAKLASHLGFHFGVEVWVEDPLEEDAR